MREVTLGELVNYVLQNRKGDAFKDYQEHQIAGGIKRAAEDGTMLYACRDDNSVCGIVTAFNNKATKTMHIHDILTTERWALRAFVGIFKKRFPEHTLAGLRSGKLMTYNTNKLCSKIMKGELN